MSKPETNIISVPLANAYLNLNQEKDEIRQYEGFNKLNAPFYGGNLSPMYKKFLGASGETSWVDAEQNLYKIENGVFTVTDKYGITTTIKTDFQTKSCEELIKNDKAYKWYYDDNNYIYALSDTGYNFVLYGIEIGTFSNFEKIFFSNDRAFVIFANHAVVYYQGEIIADLTEVNSSKPWYTEPSYTVVNDKMIIAYCDKYYIFNEDGTFNIATVSYVTSSDIEISYPSSGYLNPNQTPTTATKSYNHINWVTGDLDFNYQISTYVGQSGEPYIKGTKCSCNYYFLKKDSTRLNTHTELLDERNSYKGQMIFNSTDENCFFEVPVLVISFDVEGIYGETYGRPMRGDNYQGTSYCFQNYFRIKKSTITNVTTNSFEITLEIDDKKTYSKRMDWHSLMPEPLWNASGTEKQTYIWENWRDLTGVCGAVSQSAEVNLQEIQNYIFCCVNLDSIQEEISYAHPQYTDPLVYPDLDPYDLIWIDFGYFYTSTQSYNGVFESNFSTVIYRDDYNISTTRGYAINIADNFRLLINNGQIQALSMFNDSNYLGTLISSWTNIDIEYYCVTDTGITYVDNLGKVHVITVRDFAEINKLQCLINRYIVFNAIGLNCYDILSGTWSRIGMDWNNRFIINEPEESDTKYYMTSAIFRTTDNTPSLSMIFNADYINKVSIPSITPQFAEDIIIQMYGAENVGSEVLYRGSYVFDNDEWSTYTDSNYVGMAAEAQADLNLLIPTNLFTQYEVSYLNDIYAVMFNGFVPLYKSYNNISIIKFNYYIGSVTSDLYLDALFILQGQYYRLSNKIIYAYSYSGGVLVDTQEICNVGSLVFIGASPSEAFFWSYANRTLYRFTGARNVESVVCADSITTIYATLYDTTTSSLFMSTNIGLVVYNSFGNYIIEHTGVVVELLSTKLGIVFRDENNNLYGLYYNAVDGEEVIPVTLETSFYGSSSVQNVINDTLYLKIFNKDNISKGIIKFGGYIQQNYGETKEIVSKTVEVTSEQFDKITKNLLLRYQPDKQRGIGISWKIESDFPISFIGIGSSPTGELNVPKSNNPVITTQKYNI